MTEHWGKFWWASWETDAELALVSMGAQGFWMRLLCLAAKEGGYVRIAGAKPSTAMLARLVRATESEVEGWLSELSEMRVFSRTTDGTIYCRRMVREARISAANRENGAKGGNPNLRKDERNPPPVNPPKKKAVKAEEEEEEEEKIEPNGSVGSPAGEPDLFAKAWSAFPETGRRRSSKQQGRTVWRKAAKAAGGDGRLLAAVRAFADSDDARRDGGAFVQGFHRWLRDGRWEHFLPPDGPPAPGLLPLVEDPWPKRLRNYADPKNREWRELEWGPRPGRMGCKAPPELQRAHGFEPFPPAPVAEAVA